MSYSLSEKLQERRYLLLNVVFQDVDGRDDITWCHIERLEKDFLQDLEWDLVNVLSCKI